MKRYLLFQGVLYYPSGGWSDFQGSFDTAEEALEHLKTIHNLGENWWQIVDSTTGTIVKED